MNSEELEYYEPYFERIIEINQTTPISMEQIIELIEVAAHYSEYGILNSDELLYGIYGGDIMDLTSEGMKKKVECIRKAKSMIKFWSQKGELK